MLDRLHHADFRDLALTLPDSCVDLVIGDPPYGETNLPWDRWPDGWMDQLPRIMKPSASLWVFGSLRMFMKHGAEFVGWSFAQDIVWEKHNGSGPHSDRFRKVHELVAQFYHDSQAWGGVFKKPLFSDDGVARTIRRKTKPQHWGNIGEHFYESVTGGPRHLRSVLFCASEHGRADHPTQKPEGIISALIEYSCPPGGVVLVPFSGSGAVERATEKLDRHWIASETDPEYIAMQARRGSQQELLA